MLGGAEAGQIEREINPSVSPGQVLRKPSFVDLRRFGVVGIKSEACGYCASYVLVVWSRMLVAEISDCCVSRVTFHIPVFLFLVPLIIFVYYFGLKFIAFIV